MLILSLIILISSLQMAGSDNAKKHRAEIVNHGKTQAERDQMRLPITLENIEEIKRKLPSRLSARGREILVCKLLGNWDARIAYERGLIKFSPQRLVTIYAQLATMSDTQHDAAVNQYLREMTDEEQQADLTNYIEAQRIMDQEARKQKANKAI